MDLLKYNVVQIINHTNSNFTILGDTGCIIWDMGITREALGLVKSIANLMLIAYHEY